jgi:hypothetical protein
LSSTYVWYPKRVKGLVWCWKFCELCGSSTIFGKDHKTPPHEKIGTTVENFWHDSRVIECCWMQDMVWRKNFRVLELTCVEDDGQWWLGDFFHTEVCIALTLKGRIVAWFVDRCYHSRTKRKYTLMCWTYMVVALTLYTGLGGSWKYQTPFID